MSDQDRFEDAGQQRQHLEDIVRVSRSCGTGTPNSIQWALDEIDALRDSLTALVVAAGRMRDGWAEGDADVKAALSMRWPDDRYLHVYEAPLDHGRQGCEVVAVCCASALGVAVFVSADLVINPSQTMRIETSA